MFTRIPVPKRRHVLPRFFFGYEDMDLGVFFGECVVVPRGQADAASVVTETVETGVSFTQQSGGSETEKYLLYSGNASITHRRHTRVRHSGVGIRERVWVAGHDGRGSHDDRRWEDGLRRPTKCWRVLRQAEI